MAQRPEDFNLPLSAIRKILEDSMLENFDFTDGAKLALSRAASVFILYLTTAANAFSQDDKRKRVLGKDVLEAINDVDLAFLVPKLSAALTDFHQGVNSKKQDKENETKQRNSEVNLPQEIIILDSSDDDNDVIVNSNSEEGSSDGGDEDDDITVL